MKKSYEDIINEFVNGNFGLAKGHRMLKVVNSLSSARLMWGKDLIAETWVSPETYKRVYTYPQTQRTQSDKMQELVIIYQESLKRKKYSGLPVALRKSSDVFYVGSFYSFRRGSSSFVGVCELTWALGLTYQHKSYNGEYFSTFETITDSLEKTPASEEEIKAWRDRKEGRHTKAKTISPTAHRVSFLEEELDEF